MYVNKALFQCNVLLMAVCTITKSWTSQCDLLCVRLCQPVCWLRVCVCVWARPHGPGASAHRVCVYLHLCTQPTVHLECSVRNPSLAGEQMEGTWAQCNGEIWCDRGNSLPSNTCADCQQRAAALLKHKAWWLDVSHFSEGGKKKKKKKSVEKEKASERSAASWDEGFDLIQKSLECFHKNDISICIGGLGGVLLQQSRRATGIAALSWCDHALFIFLPWHSKWIWFCIHPPIHPSTHPLLRSPQG